VPKRDLVLTIDLGTTNCKCMLFSNDGSIVSKATASYPSYYPYPGWVEQKPDDWWAAIVTSVRQGLKRAEVKRGEVTVISVTGQMHGIVPVGSNGEALGPCLTLRDNRAVDEAEEIATAVGLSKIYRITGARLTPSAPIAKIRWLKKHEERLYGSTQVFLPCKDYIRHLLTGDIGTDPIDAAGTLMFDIRRRDWSEELLDSAGISVEELPVVQPSWKLAGHLRDEAARQLNLEVGIPVVIGAGDDIEFLGVGMVEPGTSLEHIGTTGAIMTCVKGITFDPSMSVEIYPHVDEGLWLLGGSVNAAGAALAWAARVLYAEEGKPIATLFGCKEDLLPDVDNPLIFLPYLSGERCPIWEPQARAGWLGLTLEHGRKEMLRAVVEGVVFSLKHVLEKIEEVAGPLGSILVMGDPEAELLWLTLRASIYDRPLQLVQSAEPTSLGAMILGGLCIGLFDNLEEAVGATVSMNGLIAPEKDVAESYVPLYDLYKKASVACSSMFN